MDKGEGTGKQGVITFQLGLQERCAAHDADVKQDCPQPDNSGQAGMTGDA